MSHTYRGIEKYTKVTTSTPISPETRCTFQVKPLFLLLLIVSGLTFSVLTIANGTVAVKLIEMTSFVQSTFDKSTLDYINDLNDSMSYDTPLLTLFTTFTNRKDQWRIHLNVLKNWSLFQPKVRLVLFNDQLDRSLLSFAHGLNWTILPVPSKSPNGTPLLKEMFFTCQNLNPNSTFYGFANGDILFDKGLVDTLEVISTYLHHISETLVIGMRTNFKVRGRRIYFLQNVHHIARTEGKLFQKDAEDYFLIAHNKFPWKAVPGIVIGRPAYDNFLVATAHKYGVAVVDATKTLVALHQTGVDGDYAGHRNKDAQYNNKVMGAFDYRRGLTTSTQYQTGYNKRGFIELWRRPEYKGPGLLERNTIERTSLKVSYMTSLISRMRMSKAVLTTPLVNITNIAGDLGVGSMSTTSLKENATNHTTDTILPRRIKDKFRDDKMTNRFDPVTVGPLSNKRQKNILTDTHFLNDSDLQETVTFYNYKPKFISDANKQPGISQPKKHDPHYDRYVPQNEIKYYNISHSQYTRSNHKLPKLSVMKNDNMSSIYSRVQPPGMSLRPHHIGYNKMIHSENKDLSAARHLQRSSDAVGKITQNYLPDSLMDIEDVVGEEPKGGPSHEVVLTLFTVIDSGSILRVHHLNMIKNWACFHPDVATVLFTDSSDPVVEVMAKEMNWTIMEKVPQMGSVRLLKKMFLQVQSLFPQSTFFGYIKGDILFGRGLVKTVSEIVKTLEELDNALVVGRKTQYIAIEGKDLSDPSEVEDITKSEQSVISSKLDSHVLLAHYMFPWQHIPDLVIGHSSYDNYLISLALRHNFAVVDATKTLVALEQLSNDAYLEPQGEATEFDANLLGALDYTEAYATSAQYETTYGDQEHVKLWKRQDDNQTLVLLSHDGNL